MPQSQAPAKDLSIRRVLISVSDKHGLEDITRTLHSFGCELIATSSTCAAILSYGLPCTSVDEVTGFPEILGGRVKTLHPKIFGGILARENNVQDIKDLTANSLKKIDLVLCNLYPFQDAAQRNADLSDLVENIDIGGVSLLRASAKNFENVCVLCDPNDYKEFCAALHIHGGIPWGLRAKFALKAFAETAGYDSEISRKLLSAAEFADFAVFEPGPIVRSKTSNSGLTPSDKTFSLNFSKVQDLRYGENPHQKASFYRTHQTDNLGECSLINMRCFHGKELSYNNMLDIEHSIRLSHEFSGPTAVIVKHNTPCGVGTHVSSLTEAYGYAFEADPVSPFGGIVCLNRAVEHTLALKLAETFLEAVVAPTFDADALEILQRKKNLRLVELDPRKPLVNAQILTHVQGGFLMQEADGIVADKEFLSFPTLVKPDSLTLEKLIFAFTVAKHVKSNAIVIANERQVLATAGGFTNRVDAVGHCLKKIRLSAEGAVLASDAFFPFPDSINLLAGTSIRFVIQPGGSVQDPEVIKACDRLGIGMVFTKIRHFKH